MATKTASSDQKKYMAFMDESGVSNLNDTSSDFWLSMVVIEKKDFPIIEGYLRLLKRHSLQDDYKTIHMCDLVEKTAEKYPTLSATKTANLFFSQLGAVLSYIPYDCRVFYIDKDALRTSLDYTPTRGKKSKGINLEVAYESVAESAIRDFTNHLLDNDAQGEITIESRLFNDAHFVTAFDKVRKQRMPGGAWASTSIEAKNRITSLHIANKNHNDGGLELADICAYATMRHETAKVATRKLTPLGKRLGEIYNPIKKHAYKGASDVDKRLLYKISP